MEKILAFSQDPLNAQQHCSTLAQGVGSALPGWGEKNFQVMSKQFDVVQAAATHAASVFSKSDALVGVNGEGYYSDAVVGVMVHGEGYCTEPVLLVPAVLISSL